MKINNHELLQKAVWQSVRYLKNIDQNSYHIIFSGNYRNILKKIIVNYYSDNDTNNQACHQKFFFLEEQHSDPIFKVLDKLLSSFDLVRKIEWKNLTAWKNLVEALLQLPNDKTTIAAHKLREEIEKKIFSTGISEILEMLNRNPENFHSIDKDENFIKYKNAIRLMIGSFCSGDISVWTLKNTLSKHFKINIDEEKFQKWIKEIDENFTNLNIKHNYCDKLSEYLKNRKILIIEDRLNDDGWGIVLPVLITGKEIEHGIIEEGKVEYGNCTFHYIKKVEDTVLKLSDKEILDFDIILLDLHSSNAHNPVLLPSTSTAIGELISRINKVKFDQIEHDEVKTSFPQVIIFSVDMSGLSARTMLKHFKAADYYFKTSKDEMHKKVFYSSFKSTIINALKNNVNYITNLGDNGETIKLDLWLRQFDPVDRPLVLYIMKHFKYFSAMNLVNILNNYLVNNFDSVIKSQNGFDEGKGEFKTIFSYLQRANKSGAATLTLLNKTDWLKKKSEKGMPKLETLSYQQILDELVPLKYKDLIKRIRLLDSKDKLQIIFLDDFTGSGGQAEEYMGKFAKHIRERLTEWDSDNKDFHLNEMFSLLDIHLLFITGLNTRELNYEINSDYVFEKRNFNVPGTELFINYKIHIAQLIKNMELILDDKSFTLYKDTIEKKYYLITDPVNEYEYPCYFEPAGWKDNYGLTSTYANAQGNTIPIIWGNRKNRGGNLPNWTPLFPRFFNPLSTGSEKKEPKCLVGKCILDEKNLHIKCDKVDENFNVKKY